MIPPSDDLILRYLAGQLADAEAEPVRAYLAESESRRGAVSGLRTALAAEDVDGAPPDRVLALQAFLERFNREYPETVGEERATGRVSPLRRLETQTRRRFVPWAWGGGVGAVLVLGLVLGIGHRGSSSAPTVYTTRTAEQRAISFGDGTRVVLAPQSQLTVSADFGEATRTVSLSGEAYFDVTRSQGRPFLVRAGHVSTRVLGTTFDIRHYRGDAAVQIAVQSGKVMVQGRGTPFAMSGGKVASISDSTIAIHSLGDSNSYADWTTGRLVFDETPLPAMLTALGRWYGYEFRLNDSALVSQNVSAEFKVSDPKEMMIVLKSMLGVTLSVHDNVITLMPGHELHHVKPRRDVFTPSLEIGK